jgi:hypothetical protein
MGPILEGALDQGLQLGVGHERAVRVEKRPVFPMAVGDCQWRRGSARRGGRISLRARDFISLSVIS